jgi:sec-independent protein translocase protein TatA
MKGEADMLGLGAPELILILVIVLILFGAGRLPQVFSSLGKSVREFREASEGRDTTEPTTPPAPTGTPTTPTAAPPSTQEQKPQ